MRTFYEFLNEVGQPIPQQAVPQQSQQPVYNPGQVQQAVSPAPTPQSLQQIPQIIQSSQDAFNAMAGLSKLGFKNGTPVGGNGSIAKQVQDLWMKKFPTATPPINMQNNNFAGATWNFGGLYQK